MITKLLRTLESAFRPDQDAAPRSEHELRLAAAVLMIEVMRADHHLAPEEETKLVQLIRRHFDLDDEDARDLIAIAHGEADNSVSLQGFTRQLTDSLDVNERGHIVELLWELAYADEHIDRYEEHLVRQIAEWLYVPHSSFIRARHRAAERQRASRHQG